MIDSTFMVMREEIVTSDVLEGRVRTAESLAKILERKVEEADELSEIFLEDKTSTEGKYQKLKSRLEDMGKFVNIFSQLPKDEREFLCYLVPDRVSNKPLEEKICYHKTHSDPRGLNSFLMKVVKCPYVDEIHSISHDRRNSKRTSFYKVLKENRIWIVEGRFVVDNFAKVFYVYTTARDEVSARYIQNFLNKSLKLV